LGCGATPLNVRRFNAFVLATDYRDTKPVQESEKSLPTGRQVCNQGSFVTGF
jgi:hypothetical protein